MAQWYNVILEIKRVAGSRLTGDTLLSLCCVLCLVLVHPRKTGNRKASTQNYLPLWFCAPPLFCRN